jgi:hypothetical protein
MNPDYDRVFHFHVRKTAGTSLNAAFWALGGLDLRQFADAREISGNGLTFVRFDRRLIAKGRYFFANSHQPAHRIRVPRRTFTITILRDPAARVLSYYRYLRWARANPTARDLDPAVESLGPETEALGSDFRDFLAKVPTERLLAQVAMFSKRMDPLEAADNALACTAVCFTETYAEDLAHIAAELELELEQLRERSLGEPIAIAPEEEKLLRARLAPEYAMIERVREGLPERPQRLSSSQR